MSAKFGPDESSFSYTIVKYLILILKLSNFQVTTDCLPNATLWMLRAIDRLTFQMCIIWFPHFFDYLEKVTFEAFLCISIFDKSAVHLWKKNKVC